MRISNEAAKSSEKEVNKVFNEVSAALEARRAQLLAEVHSIHEFEVKQITTESESVACSLARLSGSIQFTKQLLDNGDDVEVAAVSDQTTQTLSSLTKMTWDKRMLQPSLLRPKFKSIEESICAFGKVVSIVEPCNIIFSDMPVDALVGKELKCEVRLSDEVSERGYEAAIPKVTVSHSDTSVLKSTAVKKKDFNSWVISFMPNKPGEYKIEVQIGCSIILSQSFAVNEPVDTELEHFLVETVDDMPVLDFEKITIAEPVASMEEFEVPYHSPSPEAAKSTESAVDEFMRPRVAVSQIIPAESVDGYFRKPWGSSISEAKPIASYGGWPSAKKKESKGKKLKKKKELYEEEAFKTWQK